MTDHVPHARAVGLEVVAIERGRVLMKVSYRKDLVGNPATGVLHGGLISSLLEDGAVRLFSTMLRGEYGTTTEVEISAVAVENDGRTCLGFTIRNVGRRMSSEPLQGLPFPSSSEQLSELVGRVPLKELVRETTDIIERLFIESALQVTDGNRAYAAQMLGLSRQTLYAKLHRHELVDPQQKPEH